MRFWGKGEENKDHCAGKCRRCHPMLLRILFVIVLKGSRKRGMIALDRVCHARVNRLDKTPERITVIPNINARLFNFWWSRSRTRTAITHRRMRRLGDERFPLC